jgi:Superinfection immunity protein
MTGWLVLLLIVVYFMPWLVASCRRKRNPAAILLLNLFTGWRVTGGLAALILAFTYEAPGKTL